MSEFADDIVQAVTNVDVAVGLFANALASGPLVNGTLLGVIQPLQVAGDFCEKAFQVADPATPASVLSLMASVRDDSRARATEIGIASAIPWPFIYAALGPISNAMRVLEQNAHALQDQVQGDSSGVRRTARLNISNLSDGSVYSTRAVFPQVAIRDTGDAYIVEADVPGEPNVNVRLQGALLTISGRRDDSATGSPSVAERSVGLFARGFTLLDAIDGEKAIARLKNGVLTITLPKAERAQARDINVRVG